MPQHFRRPSELHALNALDRVKSSEDADLSRRNSAPTRVRAGSSSSLSDRSASMELWQKRRQVSLNADVASNGGASALGLVSRLDSPGSSQSLGSGSQDRALDVLIAEDNPISQKVSPDAGSKRRRVSLIVIDLGNPLDQDGLPVCLRGRRSAGARTDDGQYQ
jgi:serine/threonine-protein kinase RIM15